MGSSGRVFPKSFKASPAEAKRGRAETAEHYEQRRRARHERNKNLPRQNYDDDT